MPMTSPGPGELELSWRSARRSAAPSLTASVTSTTARLPVPSRRRDGVRGAAPQPGQIGVARECHQAAAS